MHHTDWAALLGALAQGARTGAGGEGMLLWKRVADYVGNNTELDTCRRIAEAIVSRR